MQRLVSTFACSVAMLGALCMHRVAAEDLRTWTDKSGKHKVEAEFVEILEGKVRLKHADGKFVRLPLAKLSEPDRLYLRDLLKQRREEAAAAAEDAAEGAGDAFNAGGLPAGFAAMDAQMRAAFAEAQKQMDHADEMRERMRARRRLNRPESAYKLGDKVEVEDFGAWYPGEVTGFDDDNGHLIVKLAASGRSVDVRDSKTAIRLAEGGAQKLVRADNSDIKLIPLQAAAGRGFQPNPASPADAAAGPFMPIALSSGARLSPRLTALSVSRSGARAVVARALDSRGFGYTTRVDLCDVETGRVLSVMAGPENLSRVALSPAGDRLIAAADDDAPLQLLAIAGDKLMVQKSWRITEDWMGADLQWIGWVDDSHVMTVEDESLTVWAIDGPRGVYRIEGKDMSRPAFSPGGKQFAIATAAGLFIHDAATGDVLKHITLSSPEPGREVAFSPSGKLIAVTCGLTLDVYDVASGKHLSSIYSYAAWKGSHFGALGWLSEDYVLLSGTDLVHLPSQMVVWKYAHLADAVAVAAGRVWYTFAAPYGEACVLLPLELPHAGAAPVAETDLALGPGDQVSLEVELGVTWSDGSADADLALEQFKVAATNAGFVVVDGASKRFVARVTAGEPQQVWYHEMSAGGAAHPPTPLSSRRSFVFTIPTVGSGGSNGPQGGLTTEHAVTITPRNLDLELLIDGKSVWTRHWVQTAPSAVSLAENESLEAAVSRFIERDAGFFNGALPSRILAADVEEARSSKITPQGIQ